MHLACSFCWVVPTAIPREIPLVQHFPLMQHAHDLIWKYWSATTNQNGSYEISVAAPENNKSNEIMCATPKDLISH